MKAPDIPNMLSVDVSVDKYMADTYNVVSLPMFVAVDGIGEEVARLLTTSTRAAERWFQSLSQS
jgi:hypothetical protein